MSTFPFDPLRLTIFPRPGAKNIAGSSCLPGRSRPRIQAARCQVHTSIVLRFQQENIGPAAAPSRTNTCPAALHSRTYRASAARRAGPPVSIDSPAHSPERLQRVFVAVVVKMTCGRSSSRSSKSAAHSRHLYIEEIRSGPVNAVPVPSRASPAISTSMRRQQAPHLIAPAARRRSPAPSYSLGSAPRTRLPRNSPGQAARRLHIELATVRACSPAPLRPRWCRRNLPAVLDQQPSPSP